MSTAFHLRNIDADGREQELVIPCRLMALYQVRGELWAEAISNGKVVGRFRKVIACYEAPPRPKTGRPVPDPN